MEKGRHYMILVRVYFSGLSALTSDESLSNDEKPRQPVSFVVFDTCISRAVNPKGKVQYVRPQGPDG
jgi:hypothetical protein